MNKKVISLLLAITVLVLSFSSVIAAPVLSGDTVVVGDNAGVIMAVKEEANDIVTVTFKLKGEVKLNGFVFVAKYDATKVAPYNATAETMLTGTKLSTAAAIAPYYQILATTELDGYPIGSNVIESAAATKYFSIGYGKQTGADISLAEGAELNLLKFNFKKVNSSVVLTTDTFDFHKLSIPATASKLVYDAINVGQQTFTGATLRPEAFTKTLDIPTNTQYTLTADTVANGSLSFDPAGGTYDEGTVVTVTATPDSGYQFVAFTGASTSTTSPVQITMDGNKTIGAEFELIIQDQDAPSLTLFTATAPTATLNDGSISGTTTAMEYKLSTASEYIACAGTSITGLEAGTYNIRYAAKTGFNASSATDVIVPAYVPVVTGISAQLPTLTDKAPNTDVEVAVTFKELPAGTKAFEFGLTYDNTKLTYKSFVKGTGYDANPSVDSTTTPGMLGVAGNTIDVVGVSGDQVVVTLVFTIIDGTPDGTTPLTLSDVLYGDGAIAAVAITSDKIVNGSIGIKTPVDPVVTAKIAAKAELNIALAGYVEADYSSANWITLTGAKTAGDAAIDAATAIQGVTDAKNAALSAMAAVKTLAEELADAKTAAKADLASALSGYTEANYSSANWITLTGAKTAGDSAIDAATDIDGVNTAKANALAAMDEVKTLAEEAAEALAAAKVSAKTALATALAGYVEADYSSANWITLTGAKTAGDAAIDAATDIDGVNTAKTNALAAMDAVMTKLEEAAEAIAQAIAKVNSGTFTLADLKATGATEDIDGDYFNFYKLALSVSKELKEANLDITDINNAISAANDVIDYNAEYPTLKGNVITGGDDDVVTANDAAAVKTFVVRVGKTTLSLEQALKADYNGDGIVNVTDVTNILVQAAKNKVN